MVQESKEMHHYKAGEVDVQEKDDDSFSNDICTAFISYPNFMHLASGHVDARPRSKRLLLIRIVFRVGHSERPGQDEMCGKTCMLVWFIISIPRGPKMFGRKQY